MFFLLPLLASTITPLVFLLSSGNLVGLTLLFQNSPFSPSYLPKQRVSSW